MQVNILAFGIAKDIFGSSSITITVQPGTTAAGLKNALEVQYPRLKQLSSFMLAVNSEYAQGSEIIEEKDDIAVIPPVSGG